MPLTQRSSYLALGVFLLATFVLLMIGQSDTAPTEPREKRLFEMVKNMRESGDYLVPRLKGEPHVNKPPFYPWLAAGCNAGNILPDRVANRLPSILATLATLAGMFFFCRAVGLSHLALPSILLLAICRTYISEARIANFDILLAAFCFAANAFFWLYLRERRVSYFLLAGLAFTLAFFTKATPVYAMVLVPWVILCWMERKRAKQEAPDTPYKTPALPIASIVIIGSLIGLIWFGAIWVIVPDGKKIIIEAATLPFGGIENPNAILRFFLQYLPEDAIGSASKEKFALHYKPFYFFFAHLPVIIFPCMLLLPLLATRIWRTRGYQGMPLQRWLGVSFLAVLAIFSLIKQKQDAYILPILPFVCILLADALVAFLEGVKEKTSAVYKWEIDWMKFLGYSFSLVSFAAIALFLCYFHAVVPRPTLLVVYPLAFALIGGLAFTATRRADFARMLLLSFIGLWLFQAVYHGSVRSWRSLIDTNQYQKETSVPPGHWEALFAKYPRLQKIFKYPPEKEDVKDDSEAGAE